MSREALLARAHELRGQALCPHLLGNLAQRDLAQGGEVLDAEEVVECRVDSTGWVDLAGAQAVEQRLRREVDEHDFLGAREDGVGDRLAHPDAAQLGDVVVERFQMLDVERGEDVDARLEDLLDVLVALGVLDAGHVRVRELVDQAQLGPAGEHRRQVHLFQHGLAVAHAPAGHHRQALGEPRRLSAAVALEQSDHGVPARLQFRVALEEHAVGLAYPCSHPQEDLQATATLSRLRRRGGRAEAIALAAHPGGFARHPPSNSIVWSEMTRHLLRQTGSKSLWTWWDYCSMSRGAAPYVASSRHHSVVSFEQVRDGSQYGVQRVGVAGGVAGPGAV